MFAQYPLPAAGTVYDEDAIILQGKGGLAWTQSDRLYSTVRYRYRANFTPRQQVKPGATTAQATFAAADGLTGSVSITPVAEYTYTTSPELVTWFDTGSDASAVATRLSTLYSVPRKVIDATVPYSATLYLGDTITLNADGQTFDGAVIEVADVFDGSYPVQRIKVLA
jgi:hypothetical protein